MRVFVTGATGFIGKAVVNELIQAGRQVLGLARSDKSAQALTEAGAEVHRGSVEDLECLKSGADATDGVIHLAFNHDFTDFAGSCHKERLAIEAIGTALSGSNKPFVITSGTLVLPHGHTGAEDDKADLTSPAAAARGGNEQVALDFASQGVRVSVIRLPPTNHGKGDHGFVDQLATIAKQKGVSAFIGDGMNRWPARHHLDTARLYRLALEKGRAGSVFHAAAEEGVPLKDIAGIIGKRLGVPVVSKTMEEGQELFGWLAFSLVADNPASSMKTQQELGWSPTHPTILEDLENGVYV